VDKFIGYESLEKEHPTVSCGPSDILALLFMMDVVILLAPALPYEKIREDSTSRSLTGISR
jgi:hypothetical protein